MDVKIFDDFVFVKTPYEKRHVASMILNGVWSKKEGMYRFPKNVHAMRELIQHFPALRNNSLFVHTGQKIRAAIDKYLEMKRNVDCDGDARLRPYQRVDVKYLKQIPSAGIFNEPRTGKTPTSILLMKELQSKRNLVIAPASLCLNWAKELEKWYPECGVVLVQGVPKRRESLYLQWKAGKFNKPWVMIVSKDTWKSDYSKPDMAKSLQEFDTCFVDEAHYLRNYKTAQSEAIFAIRSARKYALTGTPTVKHASDIWGILHFLYPKKFNSYWQFADRYFDMTTNFMGHREIGTIKEERQQELQELIGFISVQRKRNEVMRWLPAKQHINHLVELDKKQRKLYDAMLNDFMVEDADTVIDTPNILSQLMRLRQICLDPRLVGLDAPSAKTAGLLEWLDNNREPVVIMSMFTSYFDLIKDDIQKLGLRVGFIHGKMSNAEKEQAKVDFQNGKIDVLLCNIISAGVGFTLDRAKVIIFMDKAWNPAENEQAEDRITPTTEDKNHAHEIISIVAADTVDERINSILQAKKSITDLINEGGREAIKKLLEK
jgi:SNF2 family DNA or RNA helicase